jgi:rod shape-determining protein MreC
LFGFVRSKSFISTAALLVLGMAIGVAHNHAMSSGSPFVLQDAATTVLYPAQTASRRLVGSGVWFLRVIRSRRAILKENAVLRREVRRLTVENATLHESCAQNVNLRKELGLRAGMAPPTIAAEVISRKESSWFDTATINRGSRAGVVKGAAVVNHRGLIGQVVAVSPFTAQVATLSDPSSSVGAMVQRSRSCGMIQGQGEAHLVLTYLPKDSDVKKGDIVTSSGMGGVVPKGFVIGRVVRVQRNAVAGTTSVLVRPSVKADQLEQVSVIGPKAAQPR